MKRVRVHRAFAPESAATLLPAGLDEERLAAAVGRALELGGRPGLAVDVVLTDDAFLAELHGRFLDDPSETDVITFDLAGDEPAEDGEPEAEIYLSAERAQRVAGGRGGSALAELFLYAVHGALHLAGHDDHLPEERRAMRLAELEVLEEFGFEFDRERHAEE